MKWCRTRDNHGIVGDHAKARTANRWFSTQKFEDAMRLCGESGYRNQDIATATGASPAMAGEMARRAQPMFAAARPQPSSFSSTSGTLRDARRRNSIWRAKLLQRAHIIRCMLSRMRSDGVSGCSIAREESFEACSHEYINLLMLYSKPVFAHAGTQAQPRSKQYYVQVSR